MLFLDWCRSEETALKDQDCFLNLRIPTENFYLDSGGVLFLDWCLSAETALKDHREFYLDFGGVLFLDWCRSEEPALKDQDCSLT